ncbi:MAG: hypothetical protein ACKO0M_03700 [Cyanobium sp.]
MAAGSPTAGLELQPLFPLALGQVQLRPDPLDLALQMQAIRELQAGATPTPTLAVPGRVISMAPGSCSAIPASLP